MYQYYCFGSALEVSSEPGAHPAPSPVLSFTWLRPAAAPPSPAAPPRRPCRTWPTNSTKALNWASKLFLKALCRSRNTLIPSTAFFWLSDRMTCRGRAGGRALSCGAGGAARCEGRPRQSAWRAARLRPDAKAGRRAGAPQQIAMQCGAAGSARVRGGAPLTERQTSQSWGAYCLNASFAGSRLNTSSAACRSSCSSLSRSNCGCVAVSCAQSGSKQSARKPGYCAVCSSSTLSLIASSALRRSSSAAGREERGSGASYCLLRPSAAGLGPPERAAAICGAPTPLCNPALTGRRIRELPHNRLQRGFVDTARHCFCCGGAASRLAEGHSSRSTPAFVP
jgi:hypothetical protein